jgi:hypothetical protein
MGYENKIEGHGTHADTCGQKNPTCKGMPYVLIVGLVTI